MSSSRFGERFKADQKFLTTLFLPEVDHHDQGQAGANDQCAQDAQRNTHDHGGVVAVVVPHCAHIINVPTHRHLQWKGRLCHLDEHIIL